MKKVVLGMLALMMCLGLASCKQSSETESTPNMADVVEKAKAEGANWSVDEWKEAFKQMMLAAKPMMVEMSDLMKSIEAPEGQDVDPAKIAEVMGKIQEVQKKYPDYEKLMNEFDEAAKASENGKKVIEDEEWGKSVMKELGLPEDL